ncbi:MAG: hypothetical protein SCALA701_00840 [Candidatus Scalindua sp.]|nr:MAG: hypothetical protein SCALA701_00840 [Candidatus Scalindua sp.]
MRIIGLNDEKQINCVNAKLYRQLEWSLIYIVLERKWKYTHENLVAERVRDILIESQLCKNYNPYFSPFL